MCSGTYLCQQSHIQPQQCCQPHSSSPHPLHKTSAPNSIGLRQRGERSCRSSHRSSSVLTLLSYYVGGGREAEGCRESLRPNILVLTSTCNSWVLNPFKSLARKSSGGGGQRHRGPRGTTQDKMCLPDCLHLLCIWHIVKKQGMWRSAIHYSCLKMIKAGPEQQLLLAGLKWIRKYQPVSLPTPPSPPKLAFQGEIGEGDSDPKTKTSKEMGQSS